VELDTLMRQVGVEPRMVTSSTGQVSRYTDRATMDLFLMAYCGKVNKRIVETLQRHGVNAVGLSAMDGGTARGRRKPRIRVVEDGKPRMLEGDFAGSIAHIDTTLIRLLLDHSYVPVLTPPALSTEGDAINVDGDKLAMELAVALGARRLLIFSNTPGLLADLNDPTSTIREIDPTNLDDHLALAQGRMKKKVLAAVDAVERGVGEVILADANREDAIEAALAGEGTHIGGAVNAR
jgi:acetylglutamate/LysW-gamma-L-alpha-aminoadipate kinase